MATPEPGDQHDARSIRYRAEDLAAEVGISVPLLRSYQSKGLLPPPRHEGRVAWYGPHHRERLLHIRHLKERGYSLRMIAEAVGDAPDPPARSIEEHEVLRLADVAERSGVPVAVLRALEASGLLRPHHLADGDRYSDADVRFVRNVLALLEVGLSLEDLMRIARRQLDVSDALGRDVMDAWSQLVGARLRRPPRPRGGRPAQRPRRPCRGLDPGPGRHRRPAGRLPGRARRPRRRPGRDPSRRHRRRARRPRPLPRLPVSGVRAPLI
jgi:DNA-binding transcriptional MerR regulator